ncbi:MAG: hypothetical protein K0S98_2819, partial [Propionibacteriaceae bacterium]|nr:hypothetical protein [Propionibacteriaceae bacterium]
QPAEQIIGHHPASQKYMRSGQHLSGCHADQPSQVRQLGIQPDSAWQPSLNIARQLS